MIKKLAQGSWVVVFGVMLMAAAPFTGGNSKAPIDIEADALEVMQQQKKAIFTGNVVAKQSGMLLKADKMTVHYSGADTKSNSISKIDVDGNVFLSTAKETARGQAGNYDVVRDFITLSGSVVLTRDKNILKGTKLEYDIKNGTSKLIGGVSATGQSSGRVRGLFVPEDKKQ